MAHVYCWMWSFCIVFGRNKSELFVMLFVTETHWSSWCVF